MGREKGKVATGPSNPKKRVRKTKEASKEPVEDDIMIEGEDAPDARIVLDSDGLPIWNKPTKLSSFKEHLQPALYEKKVKNSKQSDNKLFISERQVNLADFSRFGVDACFEKLGWLENLKFNNHDNPEIYHEAIWEWMGTLKRIEGNHPPVTTKLVGTVNGKTIELSFTTFRQLGSFDTRATVEGEYEYPSDAELSTEKGSEEKWKLMIRELFVVPVGTDISEMMLYRTSLKVMPRLLLGFVNSNVMPRSSDMEKVRYHEIMVLHALMTGKPKLSARHLIMFNIWVAREKADKIVVPHARLLSKLLKKYGGISKGCESLNALQLSLNFKTLCRTSDWKYTLMKTKHKLSLRSSSRYIEVRREDVEDGVEESDEENEGQENQQQYGAPVVTGFAPNQFETPYYKYLQQQMIEARPADFGNWGPGDQRIFDRQSQEIAENRVYRQSMMRRQEEIFNAQFLQDGVIRWVNPHQQQPDESSSSSSGGTFDMRVVGRSFYESVFGPPYQPPSCDG